MEGKYYVEPMLKQNLDVIKPHVLKNWDMCFIVSGVEGAGKSTFAFQLADQLSGDRFTLEHICMTPKDFMDKITRPNFLQPGDTILLDEGFMINSRSAMSKQNREFLSILAECRQKQLFLIIICPNFFDLDKNLALWRSRGLFYIDHVSLKRGYFKFWNYERKKKLYIEGKKFFNYQKVKYNFRGTFSKHCPIDEEEYKKVKLNAFEQREELTTNDVKHVDERNGLILILRDMGLGWSEISKKLSEKGIKLRQEAMRVACSKFKIVGSGTEKGHTINGYGCDAPTSS